MFLIFTFNFQAFFFDAPAFEEIFGVLFKESGALCLLEVDLEAFSNILGQLTFNAGVENFAGGWFFLAESWLLTGAFSELALKIQASTTSKTKQVLLHFYILLKTNLNRIL